MNWRPAKLTREQMEERRLEGGRLLRAGHLSQAQIARRLGVSRAAVCKWAGRLKKGGSRRALRRRSATGRPCKLGIEECRRLRKGLRGGARAAGFETERWTLARVRRVLLQRFGVRYHARSLGRLLHRLGFSPQAPQPKARERDEAAIRAWLAHDWPRIKKAGAAHWAAYPLPG
jgi:transposase